MTHKIIFAVIRQCIACDEVAEVFQLLCAILDKVGQLDETILSQLS